MFDWYSGKKSRLPDRLTRRTILIAFFSPFLFSFLCLAWLAAVSHRKHFVQDMLPFAAWVLGMFSMGIFATIVAGSLDASKLARGALIVGIWAYLVVVAEIILFVGLYVLVAAVGYP